MIRRPPISTQSRSSAASDVYKRQVVDRFTGRMMQAPNIRMFGFSANGETDAITAGIQKRVEGVLQRNGSGSPERDMEKDISTYLYSETHRRPVVFVSVNKV